MSGANAISTKSVETGAELNIAAPWPMPQWLPDETFFSLASRYHAISGNRLPAHTSLALFGHRRWGNQHDFPTHLDQFVLRTDGRMGGANMIAMARTVLPFYLPLRSDADGTAALESLMGPPNGMLKYRLGILTSRFRANHPLKACPVCMKEDAAEHGLAYWHRSHQFPGVWVCLLHSELLQEATVKSTGVSRFGWLLPTASTMRPVMNDVTGIDRIDGLVRFARLVDEWIQLSPGAVNADAMGITYKYAISELGLLKDRNAIASRYCQAISPLRAVPELAALPATPHDALSQVNRWFFSPRGNTHPLRHLSFIFWLFGDWQTFWKAYQRQATSGAEDIRQIFVREMPIQDPRASALVELIRAGSSTSAAAKTFGVDTGTAIAWAAREGIPTGRRPKTLKENKYAALIADLQAGMGKSEAAAKHGVSLQSVTRLLRAEVGLQKVWHEVRLSLARTQARSTWLEAVSAFAATGIATVRYQEPATYAWLYRNDRDWLVASCVDIGPATRRMTAPRVNWDSRDVWLANEVRRVAAELAVDGEERHVRLWQLYQVVPELKAKLGALDRLPLTQQVIAEVTRPRTHRKGGGSLF